MIEEKEGQITILVPKCSKCDLIMSGLFTKFWREPSFTMTEIASSVTWTEFTFQCPNCFAKYKLPQSELDKVNSYPYDKVNWPPGFDSNKMKYEKLAR